ncbi:MAG: YicC/YloC family endoribonuclease [Nitrospirales bacterium]
MEREAASVIRSMTGYGRRQGTWRDGTVTVELRGVNHRYCEIVCRLPKSLGSAEDLFKRTCQKLIRRGRVDLSVSVQAHRDGTKNLSLDRSLAKQYHRALRDLQRELKLPGRVDVAMLAAVRDLVVVTDQPSSFDQGLQRVVLRLLGGALSDLDGMRRREGQALSRDIKQRLGVIDAAKAAIARRTPMVVQDYGARLRARVQQLLGGEKVEGARLSQELVFFADRCDVTEELTRLGSHVEQFNLAFKGREPAGRTLDFLLQEMGREINTIGSKANDAQISMQVVKIKAELEKIREQVQNIA